MSPNITTGKKYGDIGYQTISHDLQLFTSMLEGYNANTSNYEDLTPSRCANLYSTPFPSNHRNLFMITNHTSNGTFDNTILDFDSYYFSSGSWSCPDPIGVGCRTNLMESLKANKLPLVIKFNTGEEVEIRGCKSELTNEKCKVQFSLGIMIVVICCNLIKACAMIMTIVRSREPTLITLGDAIDSFLRIPDPTTMRICFADRRFIDREWKRGWRAGPRQWKQKGV